MKDTILKLQKYIAKKATGKNVLKSLIPALGVYVTMLLYSIPKVMQYSNEIEILDIVPSGYSPEYVQKLFETLGETGRSIYLTQQIPLDMIYPGLFAISFSLLLAYIFSKAFSSENKIQMFALLPILVGVFDYLENVGIIIMLNIFPSSNSLIAESTSIFTIVKSLLTTVVFVLIIVGVIKLLINKYKTKKTVSDNINK